MEIVVLELVVLPMASSVVMSVNVGVMIQSSARMVAYILRFVICSCLVSSSFLHILIYICFTIQKTVP